MSGPVEVTKHQESKTQKSEGYSYRDENGQVVYYLKLTESKRYVEAYDGAKTFRIYGMSAKDLEYLKANGQLAPEFSGKIYVLSKDGEELKPSISADTFNDSVVRDFKKADEKTRILLGVPSKLKYNEAEKGKLVYTPISYEGEDLYTPVRAAMETEGKTVAREKVPKNKKGYLINSAEYAAMYDKEIKAMQDAIAEYAKTGDQTKLLIFIGTLIKQLEGKVTPSKETADLMFRYMYEVQKAYENATGDEKERLAHLQFAGMSAEMPQGKKATMMELKTSDEILIAAATDEGRTWLIGILQKWERGECTALDIKGYASYATQAKVLDYVVGNYTYGKGAYKEYQDKYLKARKSGKMEDVGEVLNPLDYMDVYKRTGGDGWKALGPSTLASYMIGVAATHAKEEPKPQPVENEKVELGVEQQPPEPHVGTVTYRADVSVTDARGKKVLLDEYGRASELGQIDYIWVVSAQVDGDLYFQNAYYTEGSDKDVYAGIIKKGENQSIVYVYDRNTKDHIARDGDGNPIVACELHTPEKGGIMNIFDDGKHSVAFVTHEKPTNAHPELEIPKIEGSHCKSRLFLVNPKRELQPKEEEM